MIKAEIQIASFLLHYTNEEVQAGIKHWATHKMVNKSSFIKALAEQGWTLVDEKPEGREYLYAQGKYFVQTVEDRKRLEREAKIERIKQNRVKRAMVCPECGKQSLVLYPVNSGNRDVVPGNWKSMVMCKNVINCGYEKYFEETPKEILAKLRG